MRVLPRVHRSNGALGLRKPGDRLGAIANAELPVDVVHMDLDRGEADVQRLGDLTVRETFVEQLQYLELAP